MTGPEREPEAFVTEGSSVLLSQAWGVGWGSAALSELLDEELRPCVAVGCVVSPAGSLVTFHVGIATPYIGAAQLQGQLEALRDSLPAEFAERWEKERGEAYAFALANLPSIRDVT